MPVTVKGLQYASHCQDTQLWVKQLSLTVWLIWCDTFLQTELHAPKCQKEILVCVNLSGNKNDYDYDSDAHLIHLVKLIKHKFHLSYRPRISLPSNTSESSRPSPTSTNTTKRTLYNVPFPFRPDFLSKEKGTNALKTGEEVKLL